MRKTYSILILIIMFYALTSCKSNIQNLGVPIPQDEDIVSLGTVLDSPQDYDGRTFVMKGTIAGQCASLCEFFFRDGVHRATIFPHGYQFPRLPVDRPVTIYVRANYGEQLVLSALGVEIHSKDK